MESADIQELAPQAQSAFIIRLVGEFDIADSERLTDAFAIANSAPLVIIDLEKTDYIDSTVLSCLVVLDRTTKEREAELMLGGVNAQILRLFEVTELHKIFNIRGSVKMATENRSEVRRLTIEGRPAG
jgi:anti-sigma B factor antagonist